MLLVHNTGNKGTTAFSMYQHTTVVVFINGIGLVLSCQIQDDLSLYYNMVAANGKMDLNVRKICASTRSTVAHQVQVRG